MLAIGNDRVGVCQPRGERVFQSDLFAADRRAARERIDASNAAGKAMAAPR